MVSIPVDASALAAQIYSELSMLTAADTPGQRKLRQKYTRLLREADAEEVMSTALLLVERYQLRFIPYELIAHHAAFRMITPSLIERLGAGMDSWGKVDTFARTLAGPAWRDHLLTDEVILRWTQSADLWWRRAALVSTVAWNIHSQGGRGNSTQTLMICEKLKSDREPMVAKALSWALRELVVHDPGAVREFLSDNQTVLPAIVLREVGNKLRTGLKNPKKAAHSLPWEEPGWLTAVNAWIISVLPASGLTLTGPVEEVQRRPWSILLRFPVHTKELYFKACSPVLKHEPALTMLLASLHPDCILPLVAYDPERAWMILPDGGATLRSQFQSGAGIDLWEKILPRFAELQIDMAHHVRELLEAGIIDRRSKILPDLYEEMLEDLPMLRIGKKDGLTDNQYELLRSGLSEYRRLCGELAGFGIAETLEHDDFHDGNIFYGDGTPFFFDWGESCLAHPFFSMVVGLNGIAYRFDLEAEDPALSRLRDAYLEPWKGQYTRKDLLTAFNLALQVGAVNRALTWYGVVKNLPYRWRMQNADAVPGWLQEYLERRERYGNVMKSD